VYSTLLCSVLLCEFVRGLQNELHMWGTLLWSLFRRNSTAFAAVVPLEEEMMCQSWGHVSVLAMRFDFVNKQLELISDNGDVLLAFVVSQFK
jgi:hypothetical protein